LAEPVPSGRTTKRLLDLAKHRQMVIVAGLPEQARDDLLQFCRGCRSARLHRVLSEDASRFSEETLFFHSW
jgi:hypothetical protein